MDSVVEYKIDEETQEVKVETLYTGTRDKVLRWLEIATDAPRATHVVTQKDLFRVEDYKNQE